MSKYFYNRSISPSGVSNFVQMDGTSSFRTAKLFSIIPKSKCRNGRKTVLY